MQTPLLISTSRGFICIEENTPDAWLVDSGRGTYYGISYSDKNIYVAARRVAYTTGKDKMDEQEGAILVFDYDLNQVDELVAPFRLRDLHQLYYFNNALWIVCTYDCMIAIYRDGHWDKWYPMGEGDDAGKTNVHHLNSIYGSDGMIYLGGSIDRVGMIYRYRESDRELLERCYAGYSSHNVWRENGSVYTLSSMSGTCVTTEGLVEIVSRGNFIRGVVATNDTKYFGISESLSRASREGSGCMIKKIPSPGPGSIIGIRAYGQINEIRAPGRHDFAHPSCIGRRIDTTGFKDRFARVPLVNGPCMKEMSAWYWRARSGFQYFDIKRRQRRLQAKRLI